MAGSEFAFRGDDGERLLGRRWLPDRRPRAIVQIAHGLAEHSARYGRLAAALNAAGHGVYASDHRGHGPSAAPADLGHFADVDGWTKCIGDLWSLNRQIAAEQPGLPIVFLGHSTGSWLGQQFVSERSEALAAVAYSGSGKPPPLVAALRLIARAERLRLGKRGKSRLINSLMFDTLNNPFKPARTGSDWLSRDPAEVDAYVSDPLCGFPVTNQLAIDFLDAWPHVHSPARLARIRKDMPIYVFSGERDPIGANIGALIEDLRKAGFANLTTRIYEGARHETFNETNRDEVTRDLIAWVDTVVGT